MKTVVRIVSVLCLLLTISSCRHKELCYLHTHRKNIIVKFDWSKTTQRPEVMRLMFYNGKTLDLMDVKNMAQDVIQLPDGEYTLLAYNSDTETVIPVDEDEKSKCYLTTNSGEIVYDGKKLRRYMPPEWVCRATVENIIVDNKDDKEIVINVQPRDIVYKVTYEISGLKNINVSNKQYYMFYGSSPSVNLSGGLAQGQPCVTTSKPKIEDDKLVGEFNVMSFFLPNENEENRFQFAILVSLTGKYYVQDVSNQVYNQIRKSNNKHIHLKLEFNITFPSEEGGKSGFVPEVEDWDSVHEIIDL